MAQTALQTIPSSLSIVTAKPYLTKEITATVKPGYTYTLSGELAQFITVSSLFTYNNRVKLVFSLNESYKKNFALLKGIIEFTRSASFSFTYNSSEKTIETDILVTDAHGLNLVLLNAVVLLKKELSFKAALKHVIAFEDEKKRQLQQVYAQLVQSL